MDESRERQNIQMHQVLAALLPLSASRRLVESSGHWYEENLVSADGNSLWGSLTTVNSKHMHMNDLNVILVFCFWNDLKTERALLNKVIPERNQCIDAHKDSGNEIGHEFLAMLRYALVIGLCCVFLVCSRRTFIFLVLFLVDRSLCWLPSKGHEMH